METTFKCLSARLFKFPREKSDQSNLLGLLSESQHWYHRVKSIFGSCSSHPHTQTHTITNTWVDWLIRPQSSDPLFLISYFRLCWTDMDLGIVWKEERETKPWRTRSYVGVVDTDEVTFVCMRVGKKTHHNKPSSLIIFLFPVSKLRKRGREKNLTFINCTVIHILQSRQRSKKRRRKDPSLMS